MSRNPQIAEIDETLRQMCPNSTKVRVTVREGSWAGAGTGIIVAYEGERPYFEGYPATKTQPERGPAFCVVLDGDKKLDMWVRPDEIQRLEEKEAA